MQHLKKLAFLSTEYTQLLQGMIYWKRMLLLRRSPPLLEWGQLFSGNKQTQTVMSLHAQELKKIYVRRRKVLHPYPETVCFQHFCLNTEHVLFCKNGLKKGNSSEERNNHIPAYIQKPL